MVEAREKFARLRAKEKEVGLTANESRDYQAILPLVYPLEEME